MGNILNITKKQLNEKTTQEIEIKEENVLFFLKKIINETILNEIEEPLQFLFESTTIESANSKENILKQDKETFIEFLFDFKDNQGEKVFEKMYGEIQNKKIAFEYCIQNNKTFFMSLFEVLKTKIKYSEEVDIILNRLSYFCTFNNFLKSEDFPSCYDDMKKEKEQELKQNFENERLMLKFLNEKNINDLNSLRNLYTKKEIEKILEDKITELIEYFEKSTLEKIKETVTKDFIEGILKKEVEKGE